MIDESFAHHYDDCDRCKLARASIEFECGNFVTLRRWEEDQNIHELIHTFSGLLLTRTLAKDHYERQNQR